MTKPNADITGMLNSRIPELSAEGTYLCTYVLSCSNDPSTSYVAIWIYYPLHLAGLTRLHKINVRIMDAIKRHVDNNSFAGVEIIPCVLNKSNNDRIYRLSVHTESITKFIGLDPESIVGGRNTPLDCVNPCPGIQCIWYIDSQSL